MPKYFMILPGFIIMMLLAACQQEQALPTQIDLSGSQTAQFVTAQAALPTITPTSRIPTLPPTFTPTPIPSATPTDPADVPTATPPGFSEGGRIFYIYNDDTIASVTADGAENEIVVNFGVGSRINDLTASPDGTLLTFVAQAGGSAREVFVSSPDGSYLQQISCLGFPDVRQPTWTPDGTAITFFAAQFPDGPRDIYIANLAGSNNCPDGNNQRLLITLGSADAADLTWNPDQSRLFYGNNSVFVYDAESALSYKLTQAGAYGVDTALHYNSRSERFYYLKTVRTDNGDIGRSLIIVQNINEPERPLGGGQGLLLFANDLIPSKDNNWLLITTRSELYILDVLSNANQRILSGLRAAPDATFAPDSNQIAYTALDPVSSVEQIFITNRTASISKQLTNNPEGTITDLVWLEG